VFALGSFPNSVEQPQKIFEFVKSCAWTSRPMTGWKSETGMTARLIALDRPAERSFARTRNNLLSECARFRLSRQDADARITRMKKVVSRRWRPLVRKFGGSPSDVKTLESAFDSEGFEFES
jgi:hypothetical protein